ncbi:MAG: hypothetical protein KC621_30635 [Myxococcales bacterium]|nr:hypothetical protein [Myxococcales bacterium]
MPIPDDFEQESLYAPSQWYVHDVLEIDRDGDRVVALIDTNRIGELVEAQRPWPGHEPHLPGAVAIQVTGTLGNLHALYVLGLKASEGWVGYGTHVRDARFRKMGRIGPPIHATLTATRKRQMQGVWFVNYRFVFEQDGEPVYESEQTAAWRRHPGAAS